MKKFIAMRFVLFFFIITACSRNLDVDLVPVYKPEPYVFTVPPGFPTELNIPEDNPLTVEGIELGRKLFYDGRLSGRTHPDSLMSCSSCHKQENSFEIGLPRPAPYGITGISTPHAMLPLVNIIWNPNTFLWNGKASRIEDLVWMGVIAPHEMNGDTNQVKALFQNIPLYPPIFKKAFGSDNITMHNISRAIAQFVRTLVSSDSKFDRYMRGELQLNDSELNGFVLFTTEQGADCFHCHGGGGNPLFTTHLFYNNGKDSLFTDPYDRYSVTGDVMNTGAYKATTLRNIEFTGPYMHDGRFATLDEVIEFYSHHLVWSPYTDPLMHYINSGGVQLTTSEKEDLKAFLLTLSDTGFIHKPEYGPPADLPE
ncbi:MAG: cytochrome-c peroxidase [Bacteroidetes bacterium]|nr:cytochrome-c peroxidase [Bacteroidota bacterium]